MKYERNRVYESFDSGGYAE